MLHRVKSAAAPLFIEYNQQSRISPVFLRHNCPCGLCHHPTTHERIVCSSKLSQRDTEISHIEVVDDNLKITWDSNHISEYPTSLLDGIEHDGFEKAAYQRTLVEKYFKTSKTPQGLTLADVSIDATSKSPQLFKDLGSIVQQHGFCVVRNYGLDNDRLVEQLNEHNFPRLDSHFGDREFLMTNNTSNSHNKQLGYTNAAIDLHTDLPFYDAPPAFQVLHCQKQADMGGSNWISSIKYVWDFVTSAEHPEFDYNLLAHHPVSFHRKQETYSKQHSAPIISLNPDGTFKQIRSSYFTIEPFSLKNVDEYYNVYNSFHALTRKMAVQVHLTPGDFVLYNNHTCMHAREGFSGPRLMIGTYHDSPTTRLF